MEGLIRTDLDLCVGCNKCVRKCPLELVNITYKDEDGNVKVKIDHTKCISCGRCVSACRHKARHYVDDTERFFQDLSAGVPISLIAAPSVRVNIPEYKRLFTYLKKLGVRKIYDVSLGADICIWAHVRHIEQSDEARMITQPCPAIVSYCEIYRHDLLKRLSPIHSPMACTAIYMREYEGIQDKIAALSPCIAKSDEFHATGLAQYNVTFLKLREYLEEHNVELPDEETGFDHYASGLGAVFPIPGGLKENIEFYFGHEVHVAKAEGFSVYEKLNAYSDAGEELLPDIFDVLNCVEGCNVGPACPYGKSVFEIESTMKDSRKSALENRDREYFESLYREYDKKFDLSHFKREYKPVYTPSPQITEEDIARAFELLGKTDKRKQSIDCCACGSETCHSMARRVALGMNIPTNCVENAMEIAEKEHERILAAREQLRIMEETLEADRRVKLMFDVAPFSVHFWDKDMNIIDCNQESLKLFNMSDKQEHLVSFFELSPELQPDGRPSREKAFELFQQAFDEGRCVFEWVHRTPDGELIPAEVTLVCVNYRGEKTITSYIRDLREHKRMMRDIEYRDELMEALSCVAEILLTAEAGENMEDRIIRSMELIGRAVDVDRVQIWKNEEADGELFYVNTYEWVSELGMRQPPIPIGVRFPYKDAPGWQELFSSGGHLNSSFSSLSHGNKTFLDGFGIKSIAIIPLFIHEQFWGFFDLSDYHQERIFTEDEISILRSASLMMTNTLLRDEMMQNARATAAQLKAVISNYAGAIWSVNRDNIITLFNGLYLKELGVTPDFLEGKKLDVARQKGRHLDIIESVRKTFEEGPQDWITDIDGRMFHAHTTPILGEDGSVIEVVGSTDDITEQIRLQKELELALEKAETANRAKSAFLSNMSHEIRTPLNAILGIAETQFQNESMSPDIKEAFDKIYHSGDMLLGIINDILDLSKIEAGKLELTSAEYEVENLINDTAQLNMMRIGSKFIKFVLNVDENIPAALIGDELRVKQVLNNLLSNAFKYTMQGTVTLSVSFETDGAVSRGDEITLVFVVSDTGQGMTQEQVGKLFDEYSRFNQQANRTTEGTGLGMSITKNLIRIMKGEVFVESEQDRGSTFTVRIPQRVAGEKTLGRDAAENLRQFRMSSRDYMRRVQITREPMPYGRVLIVDDVETNIYVCRGLLAPYGMKVDSVGSGYEAIERIKAGNLYDIVFMDHMMPKMDGMEATSIIRGMGYERPIVALTANALAGQAEIFLEHGFDDFVSKPIDIRQLNTVLNKFIRDRQPPEVLEEVRQRLREQHERENQSSPAASREQRPETDWLKAKKQGGTDPKKTPAVPKRFAEIFSRDARKVIAALEGICEKQPPYGEEDVRAYIINVHGIKSALASLGFTELSAVALNMEKVAREGDLSVISSETPAFLDSLRALVEELSPKDEGGEEAKAAEDDKPFLREKLLEIKAACEAYDKKTAKNLTAELREKARTTASQELLSAVSEHLLHSEFDEAVSAVDGFLSAN